MLITSSAKFVVRRDAARERLTAIGATGAYPAVAKEIAHEH